MTRSRRAGLSRDEVRRQPLYARMLGLQYLAPSGFLCFVFLEGAIALGILLALAELVSWWGVLVLPLTVAVMVKLNDVVAGALTRPQTRVPRASFAGAGRPAVTGLEAARGIPAAGFPGGRFDSPLGDGLAPSRSEPGSPGAETVRLSPTVIAQAAEGPALRPAAARRFGGAEAGSAADLPGVGEGPTVALPPPGAGAGLTPDRRWASDDGRPGDGALPFPHDDGRFLGEVNSPQRTGTLDEQQQRARQSAARRYE